MAISCSSHRRPYPQPIGGPDDAVHALTLVTDDGRQPAVVLACLDAERRPLTMFVVENCPATVDAVERALDVLLDVVRMADDSPLDALVIGASRPGLDPRPTASDIDTWWKLATRCALEGVELLDWFILTEGSAVSVPDRFGNWDRS